MELIIAYAITYAIYYAIGFISFIIITAFLSGYYGVDITLSDLFEALLWPITILSMIGAITKAIVTKLNSIKKG